MPHAENHPTPVITAFIWDGQRILLALRSDSVSTYPRHWAGVSGYLEGDDPLRWALVELEEECGLSRDRLTLRRTGKPLEVIDQSQGRSFRVHPFLFSIDDAGLVRQDWEASRFEWVDVEELTGRRRQPTVPKLYETFDRVWPPWPAEHAMEANLKLALGELRDDREMGAGTLARAAAREVAKVVRLCRPEEFEQHRARLGEAVARLGMVRPSMTSLVNLLDDVRESLAEAKSLAALLAAIERLIARSEQAETEVARQAAERIGCGWRVMTISYSGTVLRSLLAAADRVDRVYICEGRPLFEGRRLASRLREAGLAVTLLTDAQACVLMPEVDQVLLGADSIRSNHDAVNKVGSALVALAAWQHGKPVIVAAESLKFVRDPRAAEVPGESNPPGEVWPDAPEGIDVSNVYFEIVPVELIAQIVNEDGPVSGGADQASI